VARKLKLTPKVQEAICKAILAGNFNQIAASDAGVGESTFYRWLQEGEAAQSGIKREFWEAVKKAEATAETQYVSLMEKAAKQSWQAAAWWLERKHNDRWGRREKQELTGSEGGPIQIQADVTPKQLEEYADIIRGLAGREPDESIGDDDIGESIHSPASDTETT